MCVSVSVCVCVFVCVCVCKWFFMGLCLDQFSMVNSSTYLLLACYQHGAGICMYVFIVRHNLTNERKIVKNKNYAQNKYTLTKKIPSKFMAMF